MVRANWWQWAPVRAGHQVAVHDHILIRVDRAHIAHVAVQIRMHHNLAASHQLWRRGDQPHAVTDDALEDGRLGKGALDKGRGRRQLAQIFRVAQPIRHKARGHDDGCIAAQLRIAHLLERLAAVERRPVLVAREGQPRLAPQPRQPVELDAFLGESDAHSRRFPSRSSRPRSGCRSSCLVVAFSGPLSSSVTRTAVVAAENLPRRPPQPVFVSLRRADYSPCASFTMSAHFSPIIMIPVWMLPVTMVGMTLASATRRPSTPRTRNWGSTTAISSCPILHDPTW